MIRFTFKYLRPVALFLAIAVLFQCCVIYDKKSVAIDEATDAAKVKIITTDGEKVILEKLYYKNDGLLYGITNKKMSDTINIIIPKNQIKEIKATTNQHITIDEITTLNDNKYVLDSYYFQNDTLHGQQFMKRKKEILIRPEMIKAIYLHNSKKSTTGTVFLVIGSGLTGIFLFFIIAIIVDCNKNENCFGWGGV